MTNQKYNDDADKKFCGTLTRPVNNMAIVLIKYSFFIFEQFESSDTLVYGEYTIIYDQYLDLL